MTERYGSWGPKRSFGSAPEREGTTLSDLKAPRQSGLSDGADVARQRGVDIDRALLDLWRNSLGDNPRIAMVAVGGYGRGELSPHSDIDLLFVIAGKTADDVSKATLRNVLYPLWDAGFQVGHAVVNAKQAVERCLEDLHAATSLLTARLVAGPSEPFDELIDRRARLVAKHRKALVRRIGEATRERHRTADRAGWTLAPDIKSDIGGLRDVNTVQWLDALTAGEGLPGDLGASADVLLSVREGLHAESPRKLDRIRIDLQPRVAARLGLTGDAAADELMEAVHSAARSIEHTSSTWIDEYSEEALSGPRRSGSVTDLGDGIRVEDGRLKAIGDPSPTRGMKLLAALAESGKPPSSKTVQWLRDSFDGTPVERWDPELLEAFVAILRSPHVEDALEMLDHTGGWTMLLPEWGTIRGRAQHDPYHRFTVDGHLFRSVASIGEFLRSDPTAGIAMQDIPNPRIVYIATLLHDIGKGSGENHSIAGAKLAKAAATRMGLDASEVGTIATLVGQHLLLSDTATRRDIDDGSVIAMIVGTIDDPDILRALYVLSGADGLATGRASWGEWKASLVGQLYRRALVALESGELPQRSDVGSRLKELERYDPVIAAGAERILDSMPPSYLSNAAVEDIADDLKLLARPPAPGEVLCRIDPGTEPGQSVLTVVIDDRPGTLSRTAGVLTLHRISVLTAQAYSSNTGTALERFIVTASQEPDWDEVENDLQAAYAGRLALEARLEQKAQDYRPKEPFSTDVRVLQDESEHSTVVEVRAPDALGLLYALTSAISDLDLDIHVAKIDTLGDRVVDVFYVRSLQGGKIDEIQATELKRAIQHRVRRLF